MMTPRHAALGLLVCLSLTAGCSASPASSPASSTAASAPAGSTAPATTAAGTASGTPTTSQTASPTPTPTPKPRYLTERVFTTYRLFGYSGAPNAPGQGRLGIGNLDDRMVEMAARAKPFAGGRKVKLLMELIATTVHGSPGKDGMFRTRIDDAVIAEWLAVARKHDAWLVLNIQPGRARFIDELKAYEKWLVQPDVMVALDPEWAVGPGQIPGRVFGSTTGAALNESAAYLSGLVRANDLPEKVMIYHQLHVSIVKNIAAFKPQPGVAVVNSIDGIGSPGAKIGTYNMVVKNVPAWIHKGFKLFYLEDVDTGKVLMTPAQVLALKPQPEYILFE